jgi:hypothetical protein
MQLPRMKSQTRMDPLVEQVYFNILGYGSDRTFYIDFKKTIFDFINQYKTTNTITIKNSKGKRLRLHFT